MTSVVLVDRSDNALGTTEKIAAHRLGLLHRAFSVFITNGPGQTLLQRRAKYKYHSGGLWANSCCGHPERADAGIAEAAQARVWEELGIEIDIVPIFTTVYRARVSPEMIEFEFVHGFWGYSKLAPEPNAREVSEVSWCGLDMLALDVDQNTKRYAPWLIHYVRENDLISHLKQRDAAIGHA